MAHAALRRQLTACGLLHQVLERRGRCLGHTMLDHSLMSLCGGCGVALLFGSLSKETAEQAALSSVP